ncbi:hypothetical protein ACIBCM_31040 [Streptomyces sp. NPDC051018]|uniref:hypothetical protein n=1 Tax=Streptomyces sp. NPDC051018 TaxID=3365639 RepID=UPI0037921167
MTSQLAGAQKLLDSGDIPGAVRALRPIAETTPLRDLAQVVRQLATAVGFEDLAGAAKTLTRKPDDPQALFDFGYGCIDRGISFLAVPALRQALRRVPDSRSLLSELVSALEGEHRHEEAAALLAERDAVLHAWPERYLLVYNSLLAGDLARAHDSVMRLPPPDDHSWEWAYGRISGMLHRAELAAGASPLDRRDLRGWHYTLTGGHLAVLSPYGFDAGMNGRYAYVQDSVEQCRRGLGRLALALRGAGREPRTVSLLPGRAQEILGVAAARVLALPLEPYDPQRTDTVVVAYDLNTVDRDLAESLRYRPDGQILYEHATCWTGPPAVGADMSGLLCQSVVEPWGPRLRAVDNGVEQLPPDPRPEADIAAEIAEAAGEPDPGDGQTPDEPDEMFGAFVAATASAWATGPRSHLGSPGPVPSSRFDY